MILFAEDAIRVNEKLFLFARDFNILFSIDIIDGSITFLGSIPKEEALCNKATCKLVYWKEQIIIVPLSLKKIWIYSLNSEKWTAVEIKGYKENFFKTNFRQAIIYENFLYFIGGHYSAILKMDLNTFETSHIVEPFLRYHNKESEELYFRGDFVCRENILYLASCKDNFVLAFRLDTQDFEWIEVGGKENQYSGIAWDGSNYWISPRRNTPIVKWDGKNLEEEYEIPFDKRGKDISYSGIIEKNNKIIIPALAGSGAHTIILTKDGVMGFENKSYTFCKKTENNEYLSQDMFGNIIFINEKNEEKFFSCKLSNDMLHDLLNVLHIDIGEIVKNINTENSPFSLHTFLQILNKVNTLPIEEQQNTGMKLWKLLRL